MRKATGITLVLGLLAAMSPIALAQDGRSLRQGLISGFMLLIQKSVQMDLKLSDDQIKAIEAAQSKMNQNSLELRNLDQEERAKKLAKASVEGERTVTQILNSEQIKRFQAINRQQEGLYQSVEAKDGAVAAALKITEDQKEKFQTIGEEMDTEMHDAFKAAGGDQSKLTAKMQELRKRGDEEAMGLLAEEQKAKWNEVIGEPFHGEISFPQGDRP